MPKQHAKQTLDEKFIVSLHANNFCVYEGILNAAHEKKLQKPTVQILQFPSEENNHEAICQAAAETESGVTCSDVGDANINNVNSKIVPQSTHCYSGSSSVTQQSPIISLPSSRSIHISSL